MSEYEDDFEQTRPIKKGGGKKSLNASTDSIEEYIGDFEDHSKPG